MTPWLSQYWKALALRGVLAIGVGIAALIWPVITLQVVVLLFGAFALADGVVAFMGAVAGRVRGPFWWALLLEGLCGVVVGAIAILWPGVTALFLLFLIAFWAIAFGVLEIMAAVRLRREMEGELWLGLSGVLSVLFGLILILAPAQGLVVVAWLIGAYAIVFGGLLLALGLRLRRRGRLDEYRPGRRHMAPGGLYS
jgi:uncharacterized membrane protein HdeD (DUF308 family)